MLELLLLRHGKAKKGNNQPDAERPLKERGKRGAQKMGAWLQTHGLAPDCVLSSPVERAMTTAEKCIKAMGGHSADIERLPALYGSDIAALLNIIIERASGASRIMLVGHNPLLGRLVEQLLPAAGLPQQEPIMPPGSLLRIELPETGALPFKGMGRLLDRVDPEQLPDTFPFPVEGGVEQRERPAYYYTQSAVIPYRFVAGELQLLMITTGSGRWWGVPKGIVEPGLSPQESAAKEALEEAGVIGQVHPEQVGCYTHAKWGADCTVSLYAMAVDRLLDESEWDETHRVRRWTSVQTLPDNIKNAELNRLLTRFPDYLRSANLWQG